MGDCKRALFLQGVSIACYADVLAMADVFVGVSVCPGVCHAPTLWRVKMMQARITESSLSVPPALISISLALQPDNS